MGMVLASRSFRTLSCVMARFQSPRMASSWKRKTRCFALEGSLRTCSCSSASVSSIFPSRRLCSAGIVSGLVHGERTALPGVFPAANHRGGPSHHRLLVDVRSDIPEEGLGGLTRPVLLLLNVLHF